MLKRIGDATRRTIDDHFTITELYDGENFKFDVALGELDGDHGLHINHVSDRVYVILNGNFIATVGKSEYAASDRDTVVIPAGQPHGIRGTGTFLIITSPPFDPNNEDTLD